jgi:hypothetical protein
MSSGIHLDRSTRIQILVPEDDVMNALLILRCYSCIEYCVHHGHAFRSEETPGAVSQDLLPDCKISVSAKCHSAHAPTLLEELAVALGETAIIHADNKAS